MKNNILVLFLLLISGQLFAQEKEEGGGSSVAGTKEVDISRTVNIQDAKKLSVPIKVDRIRVNPPNYTYSIIPKLFEVNPYYSEPLQAISLGEPKLEPLKRGYTKLGLGNYRNLEADVFVSSKRNKKYANDLRFIHKSGKASPRYSNFGKTALGIGTDRIFKNHTMNIALQGQMNRVHHFAYINDLFPELIKEVKDKIETDYYLLDLQFNYDNLKSKSQKHKFKTYLKPYYLATSTESSEWAIVGGAYLTEKIEDNKRIKFHLEYDYNSFDVTIAKISRNIAKIGAQYQFEKDDFEIKAGFITASDNSKVRDFEELSESKFYIFPNVKAQYNFTKEQKIYAIFDGELQKNSFRSLSTINPFVDSRLGLKNTIVNARIKAGLKGLIFNNLNYHFYGCYSDVKDFYIFSNGSIVSPNYFDIIYAGASSGIAELGLELDYAELERVNFHVKGTFRSFQLKNDLKPMNLSPLEIRLNGEYDFQEKIKFTAQAVALGKRDGVDQDLVAIEQDPIMDIGLGVDYALTSSTKLYICLNNLLHQKYELWNAYQVQGFHILLGVKASF